MGMFPAVAAVEGYWDGLANGSRPPARADIDPRGLEEALEYAFILERIAPGIGRFRLAGMHLNDLMGMEVRGMPLTAMFTAAARKQVSALTEAVCADPQIATLTLQSKGGIGRPSIDSKMLMAPLLDETGQITRILGCFQSKGQVGRQPRRFDVIDAQVRSLTPIYQMPSEIAKQPIADFAESQTPFLHRITGDEKRAEPLTGPALRLVSSND